MKARIMENRTSLIVVKESNTLKKSAKKKSRPMKAMIMENQTSLIGVGQRNNEFSVATNKRLHTNQTDDAKLNEKKLALPIETETPESLKFVINSSCTMAKIENETQLNGEENQDDFFIQSGSEVKRMTSFNDRIKLPFVKSSPLWEAIESSEVLLTMPQQPHFLPLKQYSENYREGMAIGLMVTFSNVVDNIRKLCISDPDESIEQMMETLIDLERHGFNSYNLRDMLECVRTLKEDDKQLMDKMYVSNELISDMRNKEGLLNERLEAIRKSIVELEHTQKSLNDEKSSTLQQMEGFDLEIIKLQNDKKTIEKSFLTAKISLHCASGSRK